MSADTDIFVDFLTAGYPAGFWEARCFDREGNVKFRHFFAGAEQLKAWLAAPPKLDVYVGVFPRARPHGKSEDVLEARALYVEFDCGDAGIAPTEDTAREIRDALLHEGVAAGLVGSSGHGIHAYFPLSEPLKKVAWDRLENALQRLAAAKLAKFNPDVGVKDYARIMRVLGTPNRKREPVVPSCVYIRAPAVNVLADLKKSLEPYMKKIVHRTIYAPEPRKNNVLGQSAKPCPALQRLMDGVPRNWRHDALFTLASFAEGAGWPRERTRVVSRKFNLSCEPPKSEGFVDGQLDAMFREFDRDGPKSVGCKSEGLFSTVLNRFCPYENDKTKCPFMTKETGRWGLRNMVLRGELK